MVSFIFYVILRMYPPYSKVVFLMFVLGLLVGYTQLQASLYIKNDDINKRERVAGNVFTVQFFFY